jgi:hypothetical protein
MKLLREGLKLQLCIKGSNINFNNDFPSDFKCINGEILDFKVIIIQK